MSFLMKHPLIMPGKQIYQANAIESDTGHPFVIGGILATIFESQLAHDVYLNTPFNDPARVVGGMSSPKDGPGGWIKHKVTRNNAHVPPDSKSNRSRFLT
jgi:hypothetical protein